MSDILERLNERLDLAGMPDDYAPHDEGWRVRDDDSAAWASRKLRDAHGKVAEIDAWAAREKERIDAVAEEEKRSHERDIEFFQTHLALWLRELISEGRAKKSIALPGGKIALRARQPKLNIENEEHLLDYLRGHHPELVKVKESLDRAAFKKAVVLDGQTVVLADTGEVLSDVWAEPQEDSISFAPAEDDE